MPLDRITEALEEHNTLADTYNADVASFLTARNAYDREVAANLDSYTKNKAEYDERGIFTCLFGCEDQTWDEISAEEPVRPARPAPFAGYLIDDLEVEGGMGAYIAGELDITQSTGIGSIKAFGVLGQVTATGMGFAK